MRCIAVHPTQPLVLTCSDDMLIKLWNWEEMWANQRVFEGHTQYIMQIVFNPRNTNTFASASLDHTVKVWQLGSNVSDFTFNGHNKGVTCVDFYHGGDKPYLISGAEDRLVKIWDYQNKTCVKTFKSDAQTISSVSFHSKYPIFLTGSEGGSISIWHFDGYQPDTLSNYGFEQIRAISCDANTNHFAVGCEKGSVVIRIEQTDPKPSLSCRIEPEEQKSMSAKTKQCQFCNKVIKYNQNYQWHLKTQHYRETGGSAIEKKHKCHFDGCKLRFYYPSQLRAHIERKHDRKIQVFMNSFSPHFPMKFQF